MRYALHCAWPLVFGAIVTAGMAGCGGGSSSPSPTPTPGLTYQPSASRVPECARAGKAVHFPAHFPQNFPVPPGTAITGTRVPIGGGIAATGYVPSTNFAATVHFFPNHLPGAGFRVLHLEVDAPHDSEGSYTGHGYTGGWALRSISGCHAMTLQISAVKGKT